MHSMLLKSIGALLFVLWTGSAVGCDEQTPPEGKMVCQNDSQCPSDWFCDLSDHFCYSVAGDVDAGNS